MLIAVALWPAAFAASVAMVYFTSIAGAQRMNDGRYYASGQFGNYETSPGEILAGALCFGGFCSTSLFAFAMIVLSVCWFATKD